MNNIIKRIISFAVALKTVIILSCLIITFHFLVVLQIIPFENVWAGKLKSVQEMYVYESISIVINCFLVFIVLVKGKVINIKISTKVIDTFLWVFVILFSLNTLGNLTSKTSLETLIATPLTFILALLCWRIVINRKNSNEPTT